jgi:hypothetical protein
MVAPTVGEAERLHGGISSARLLPTLELSIRFWLRRLVQVDNGVASFLLGQSSVVQHLFGCLRSLLTDVVATGHARQWWAHYCSNN